MRYGLLGSRAGDISGDISGDNHGDNHGDIPGGIDDGSAWRAAAAKAAAKAAAAAATAAAAAAKPAGLKRAESTADHRLNIAGAQHPPKAAPSTAPRVILATRQPAARPAIDLAFGRLTLCAAGPRRSEHAAFRRAARRVHNRPPAPASVAWRLAADEAGAARQAEGARAKLRRVSPADVDGARDRASTRYVRGVRLEAEETQRFLAGLAAPAAAAAPPAGQEMDAAVGGTLAHIACVRREFARARAEETRAAAEAVRRRAEAEAGRRKAAAEASRRQAEEAAESSRQQAEASRRQAAEKAADKRAAAARRQARHVSAEGLAWADAYRAQYAALQAGVAARVRQSAALRAYCFRQRGVITRSVGQLKDSMAFVRRVAQTVGDVVEEAGRTHGADARLWMLNLAAKAVVRQAEAEVAVAPPAAYPLAAAAVLLAQRFAELPALLLVRLVKKCPVCVPAFPPREPGQPADAYRRSIGYREQDEGVLESEALYAERMAGMVALLAALAQTPALDGRANPVPLALAWTWLARMLNLPPRAISPLLVLTVLTTAGTALAAAYGRQFAKLMDTLEREWIPGIAADDPAAVAARSNLEGFVDEYRRLGVLRECDGRVIKPQ
ncbi:hypothetical protein LPJ53_001745 [Coemansia erecta]|uniref:mRNA export factor GLE1 n=1 Tax=Coemansia erecta TaxID=147472 RepID=A0A9W7Y2R8_9FUNG|nr:hypothetical protein LPJ53_001745 [Coemansia erecta]